MNAKIISDYLADNFSHENALRLSNIKIIATLLESNKSEGEIQNIIDKVALFNGIKKV